jgi:hypothetical protein
MQHPHSDIYYKFPPGNVPRILMKNLDAGPLHIQRVFRCLEDLRPHLAAKLCIIRGDYPSLSTIAQLPDTTLTADEELEIRSLVYGYMRGFIQGGNG